jgi:hypothetical protein
MNSQTEMVLFEDRIKYDPFVKFLLVIPILLLVVLALLFYMNASSHDIFPNESKASSEYAAKVLFASSILVIVIYMLVLPRSILVLTDKLGIRYGIFNWNIPYKDISSVTAVKGISFFAVHGSVTAFGCQIEIGRKKKMNIRVCPSRRDQFLQQVERALADWQRI